MNDQMIENLITGFMKATICSFLVVVIYLGTLMFNYHQTSTAPLAFGLEQAAPSSFPLIG